MTDVELQFLTDARLSADARVLGLYLAHKGEGVHEIAQSELADVLSNECSADRVRRAVAQLCRFKWVEKSRGGRNHFDVFEFKHANNLHVMSDNIQIPRTLKPTVVVVEEVLPPVVPLRALDPKADAIIEASAELMTGFRGSMRDYLIARVAQPRQYAYAQLVAGWMNDIDPSVWALPDGGWVKKPDRPPLLAAAFNDLAASDEGTMKRPVGDPANLKTKLNILIKQRENGTRTTGSRDATTGPRRFGDNKTNPGERAGGGRPDRYAHLDGADTRPAS